MAYLELSRVVDCMGSFFSARRTARCPPSQQVGPPKYNRHHQQRLFALRSLAEKEEAVPRKQQPMLVPTGRLTPYLFPYQNRSTVYCIVA